MTKEEFEIIAGLAFTNTMANAVDKYAEKGLSFYVVMVPVERGHEYEGGIFAAGIEGSIVSDSRFYYDAHEAELPWVTHAVDSLISERLKLIKE